MDDIDDLLSQRSDDPFESTEQVEIGKVFLIFSCNLFFLSFFYFITVSNILLLLCIFYFDKNILFFYKSVCLFQFLIIANSFTIKAFL